MLGRFMLAPISLLGRRFCGTWLFAGEAAPLGRSGARRFFGSARSAACLALIVFHGAAQPRLDWVASLHGNGADRVASVALDDEGNIYLTGSSTSFDLGTAGVFQPRRLSSNLYSFSSATQKLSPLFPPDTSQIYKLVPDAQHPGTIYAASRYGLIKTKDNGLSWTSLSIGFPSDQEISDVAVAPSQPGTLYAVFRDSSATMPYCYKSTDAGATWTQLTPLPQLYDIFSPGIWGVAIDPADASHVFIYGSQTAYSTDGGASWTQLQRHILRVTFDPGEAGTVYAGAFSGNGYALVRSTDNGRTFVSADAPPVTFITSIWPDPLHPGTVYLSANNGISKSVDAGASWNLVSSIIAAQLAEDPATGSLYAMTSNNGVSLSNDGFRTSTAITQAGLGYAIAVPQSGTLFFATDPKREMFVSKLDPNGHVIFTTYIGGIFGSRGTAIAVDPSGEIYIASQSESADFPRTASLKDVASGTAMYLLKLSSDGTRVEYSTRIADRAVTNALALDSAGNVYLAGTTGPGYPTTPNSAQPDFPANALTPPNRTDAFASKFAIDGKTLIYSTYLGEAFFDRAASIVVDPDGNAYVTGTRLWKLDPTGGKFIWSTVLRPGEIHAARLDGAGNLYVCGGTPGGNLYTSANAFQQVPPPYFGPPVEFVTESPKSVDAFVAKFSSAGDVIYSTLLGGRLGDVANAIVVDAQGNAIVAGTTESMDFPVRHPFQAPFSAHTGFLAKLNADGSDLIYSTYLGDFRAFDATAIGLQRSGSLIMAGYTSKVAIAIVGGTNGPYKLSPANPTDSDAVFLNQIIEGQSPAPIHVDSLLNTASLAGGPVSPGEWITVRGGGFRTGSIVLLGDQPLSIASISNTEILTRVPDTFESGAASTIRVTSGDQSSPSIFVSTAPAAPAFFTQDSSGIGQALAFNADGSQNGPGNPAARGSAIEIVANGLGVLETGSIQVYFSGGFAVLADVRTEAVPGLPGDRYSIIRAAIPGDVGVFQSTRAGVALILNGILQVPFFTVTISVQ
jgi:photosystem II stability/assembly factor-like uncharacterized protein